MFLAITPYSSHGELDVWGEYGIWVFVWVLMRVTRRSMLGLVSDMSDRGRRTVLGYAFGKN